MFRTSLLIIIYYISLHAESDPCSNPNPCLRGLCTTLSSGFSCNCSGTGYTGSTCDILVVPLPSLPPVLTINTPIDIEMFSDSDFDGSHRIRVTFSSGDQFKLILRSHHSVIFTWTPRRTGIVTFTMISERSSKLEFQPQERRVFVRENTNSSQQNSYFDTLQLSRGTLKKGCCSEPTATYPCPNSAQTIVMKSACRWSVVTGRGVLRAPGIVHAEVNNFSLPVSIAGYRLSRRHMATRLYRPQVCTPCDSAMPLCDHAAPYNDMCYCYALQEHDRVDFINSRALALTYINDIQDLLPSWLKMSVNLSFAQPTSPFSEDDFFAEILQNIDVSTRKGCNKINAMTNGVYSVLRYDKTISAEIDNQLYIYVENSETGNRYDPMCIAVNLCQVRNSPVFIQPSQPVHNILVSHHLKSFISKGWEIQINALSVSRPRMFERSEEQYWNGVQMVTPPQPMQADVSINANIKSIFNSKYLNIALEFTGDAEFLYKVYTVCMVESCKEFYIETSDQFSNLISPKSVTFL